MKFQQSLKLEVLPTGSDEFTTMIRPPYGMVVTSYECVPHYHQTKKLIPSKKLKSRAKRKKISNEKTKTNLPKKNVKLTPLHRRLINFVKSTNFSGPCKRKTTILNENFKFMYQDGLELKKIGWSVKAQNDGRYLVILNYRDSKKSRMAIWAINWKNKRVKYQNRNAELVSCLAM